MDKIQYEITLTGEYIITNSCNFRGNSFENLPIRMRVKSCNNEDLFMQAFNKNDVEPEFQNCWRDALFSKNKSWKLLEVAVGFSYIKFEFFNEDRYNKRQRSCALGKVGEVESVSVSDDKFFIMMEPWAFAKDLKTEMRFECNGMCITDITIKNTGFEVLKRFASGIKIFDFVDTIELEDGGNGYRMSVTEYLW